MSRPRSSSNGDVSRPPPCYSSIGGAPPTIRVPTPANPSSASEVNTYPPSYSSVFRSREERRTARRQNGHSHSASTTAASAPTMHEYHIRGGAKDHAWATVRLYSRSVAGSSSGSASGNGKVPKFTSNDLVQGCLELNLENSKEINWISLSLRGRIITSSYEGGSYTFLDHPIVNWTKALGDPRSATPPPIPSPSSDIASPVSYSPTSSSPSSRTSSPVPGASRVKKFDGRFCGSYVWPFSFAFPKETVLDGKRYPTPQTFLEKGINGNVQYDIVLRMSHGMLRADSKLQTTVVYMPDVVAPPTSLLSQLAYTEGMPTPSPDVDSEGWYTPAPTTIRGSLLTSSKVKLQAALSFAQPRSYVRGSIIPLHLSISTANSDTHALDVLANPKAIAVRLTRRVRYYEDANQALSRAQGKVTGTAAGATVSGNANGNQALRGEAIEEKIVVEKAVWWQAPTSDSVSTRCLAGEIHLEKELQSSCGFLLFDVSYSVELLPFDSPVFKYTPSSKSSSVPDTKGSIVLASYPVAIATSRADGPSPVSVTKPKPRKERSTRLQDVSETNTYSPEMQMWFR